MDGVVVLGLLLILTVLVGSVMGIFSFFEVKNLRREVLRLRDMLDDRQLPISPSPFSPSAPRVNEPEGQTPQAGPVSDVEPRATDEQRAIPESPVAAKFAAPRVRQAGIQQRQKDLAAAKAPPAAKTAGGAGAGRFWSRVQDNWMVWLGGACVALAGIFLARYGIEQGLLGPRVRVAMGLVLAGTLYAASEWLRRTSGATHPTFAALAGGGAITAFAAILSAVHLYSLFAPGLAFALLALVAVVTMWMARLHGPVLAAIGMLGAYSVPALVATDSGNVLGAMVYALIITTSVLLLLRHVYRSWLWIGLLAGALAWWLISLFGHQADGWRGPYLAVLAYLLLAVVPGDWLLGVWGSRADRRAQGSLQSPVTLSEPLLLPGLLVLVAAQCVSIFREGLHAEAIWSWSPLAVVLLVAAGARAQLAPLSWALLLGQCAVWIARRVEFIGEQLQLVPWPEVERGGFLLYLGVTALIFSVLGLRNYRLGQARYWWASLAVMAPLLALLLGYLLAADYLPLYWWCLYAAVFGGVLMFLGSRGAGRGWSRAMVVWLLAAAHFAYSLAVCLWLEQASLTLALALQSVSLAWLIRRFDAPALGWLLKAVLLLVVVRLTFNPWLLSYTDSTHWSLWTYGGSALCAWGAARLLAPGLLPLARWCEAAALHLLVLALWAECRYWLYGGNALATEFSFVEAVIDIWLFAGLGMVYYRKSLVAGSFSRWYDGYGRLLMMAAFGIYLRILAAVADSQPWVWQAIGERPLFNMLLPAFAGPALLALVASRYYLPVSRKFAAWVAALAGFIWVSLEVRHLWLGTIRMDLPAVTGELYSYSAVWLILAVAAILLGSWRGWRGCYQGGMAVLAVVIVKLFLVDMSGLEGLLRVASFMGLGLALLAIAYLHQKLGGGSAPSDNKAATSSVNSQVN
ncbi:DUF2339 domain-containing protein [Microbulbifer bruguierae]|uniref:DUF2339 domain-containing protein n=1 Tax=Microbulbifer bruguierae TaxID=3029061 RepID=A0ABY8NC15_9GAMM|nr:DUF2339 domain-containing protein [Microbulbifer bruguierae]WGL16471.1 DUF2339 domain-containing protein [Microbulbifer bruguierae]